MAGKEPYSGDKKNIDVDRRETPPEPRESATQAVLVPFSIRLPQEQKERLESYLEKEKGQKLGPFVRQLITEYMREKRIW